MTRAPIRAGDVFTVEVNGFVQRWVAACDEHEGGVLRGGEYPARASTADICEVLLRAPDGDRRGVLLNASSIVDESDPRKHLAAEQLAADARRTPPTDDDRSPAGAE